MSKKHFNKFLSYSTSLLILISSIPVITASADTTNDGLIYEIYSQQATITGYEGSASTLSIPSKINNYPVTSISFGAFDGCTSLKTVTIPSSFSSVSSGAFRNCTSLENVSVPDTVTLIGAFAFDNCAKLKSINIPNAVLSIDESSFSDCTSLESISIPEATQKIGNGAFSGCTKLNKITLPKSVTKIGEYAFDDTAYYNNNSNWSDDVLYIGNALIEANYLIDGNYSIKDDTTCIADKAFSYCSLLDGIVIPDSITAINYGVFQNCSSLDDITIPNTVTKIEDFAFYSTAYYNDKSNWDNNVLYIDNSLIKAEDTLSGNYNVKDECVCIADYAFSDCDKLESITLPSGIKRIGESTFFNCSKLSDITISENVTEIEDFAFSGCGLTDVHYSGSQKQWDGINIGSFNTNLVNATLHCEKANADPIQISKCSVTLSQTSYTYDATQKKPDVTVKHGSKTLTSGIDYTVSYSNNVNVGTAVVTVTGKGDYIGSVTKNFTIKAEEVKLIPISDCTVTLGTTSYSYDSTAKKPSVTVKHGSKMLTNGTDYTVSYSNNVNVGTAVVTITGKGKYTGTVTKNFLITQSSNQFKWGIDNWNFNNSAPNYFPKSTYRNQISSDYQNTLKDNLTNTEYQVIFKGTRYGDAWIDDSWGGSCYGMASTTLLAKNGFFPYSQYKTGATSLYELTYPNNDSKINSLVTYYQMLQVKDVIQQQYRTVPNKTHKENIQNILSLLDNNSTVLLGFKKSGWGGHAILAYGYEYGSWTFNGVTYDGCIKICDPNTSMEYNTKSNIYFNTKTYNWTIPLYSYVPITSASGAVFNYIGANVGEINEGGYLSGTGKNNVDDFVARIDAVAISENRSVSKVSESNGIYMNNNTAPGEIIEDYSYILGGESEGTVGYTLYDADSAYRVTQANPVELQLSIDYENSYMTGGSLAGTSVIFDKDGFVEVEGEAAEFNITMTFDSDYATDWFTIQVSGSNADRASLEMVENGYILSADNLENINVETNNRTSSAVVDFSTEYNSVFIYQINATTIGVRIDSDNNGTYETDILSSDTDFIVGDINNDDIADVRDVTLLQMHLANYEVDVNTPALDVNKDGIENVVDVTFLQMLLAGYELNT